MGNKITNILLAVLTAAVCVAVVVFINVSDTKGAKAFEVPQIAVHVKGAVKNPGLYEFDTASRVADAIAAAGGEIENADINAINLAQFLEDGSEVVVPAKNNELPESDAYKSAGKINVNTADESQLCLLEGIGPVTAKNIIEYRQNHGNFSVKEELMNVSGIGEKIFEKIKERISI